ncbi:MAG TPA: hypothetical protein VIN61_06705 [Gammaproteobacteria bacterium]
MWLAKPVYEAVPLSYIGFGLLAVGAAWRASGYRQDIYLVIGLASIVIGVMLWLKRHGHRASRSRKRFDDAD